MLFRTIRTKLFFVFLAISVIPVFIITYISYNSYTKLVGKQVSLVASNTVSNTVERIDNIFQNIDRITLSFQQFSTQPGAITVSQELNKLINKPNIDQYDFFLARTRMLFFFNNLVLSNSYLNGIYIFLPSGNAISYGNGTDLAINYQPIEDEWYKQTLQKGGGLYISDTDTKPFIINAKPSITFSRALYDPDTRQLLGVLMLDCDLNIFKGIDKDIVPNITNMFLANGKGKILYDNSKSRIGQMIPDDLKALMTENPDGTVEQTRGGTLSVIKPFPDNDWRIIASLSLNELYKQYGVSQRLIIYIALSCAVIFLLLSVVLSGLITKPIIELSRLMRKNKSLHFVTTKKHLERDDEIGILYMEYNKMIKDIDLYIKESYQNKLITLDSQMKALEAQINSHFLYNTLEAINSIAEIEEVESISIMTKALGDMFRYSIKTESELVAVEDELAHVNNYLSIQKIRFEHKIDFHFYIQSDLYAMRILKLILQPVIENALYHGLEKTRNKGTIAITGYTSNAHIIFEVTDNGVGMSEEQLSELQKLLSEPPEFHELGQRNKRSIGLKNVHSRIVLYYGVGYGLTLESEKDKGTKVTITVPNIFQE
ncbi:sensor histidine kinase [Paenibacillus whitsoniae]|uniref:Sensor histidine kinase n=1 Tax=Paenibacillus whitsoniae TaxID=2496558 RepID=A0A430JL36_9BACL|nr:sensor histidine kinase [Paenibacillus whitsoniae]RTE11683.1 sensor histidine kinase [Paenibacillus whitsoniae]